MREIQLSVFKRQLSKHVLAGEPLVITKRGKAIATLTPGGPAEAPKPRSERPDDDRTHVELQARVAPPSGRYLRLLDVMRAALPDA